MSRYKRHEYMWSNHSITGKSVGWGITASSEPDNKKLLREIEKLAAAMPVPQDGDPETEGVFYGSECGFVFMLCKPYASGEDGRRNKKVLICQSEGDEPEEYMARHGWDENPDEEVAIPKVTSRELIGKLGITDIYPVLLHRMTTSIFEENQSLNLVIPDLNKNDFGVFAGSLMLLYHKYLPKALRKRAGYVSYSAEELHCAPYYFSDTVCGRNSISLKNRDEFSPDQGEYSELEKYFIKGISDHFIKEDSFFEAYNSVVSEYIEKHRNDAGLYSKLQWIYYIFERQHGGDRLSVDFLKKQLPELMFWGSKDEVFGPIVTLVSDEIHEEKLSSKEEASEYIEILMQGVSARSMKGIVGELHLVISELWSADSSDCKAELMKIKNKNNAVFTTLMMDHPEEPYANRWFLENTKDLDSLEKTVGDLEIDYLDDQAKDVLFGAGIGILNRKIFEKEAYEQFDAIACKLGRKKKWVSVLKNLIDQMAAQKEYLSEDELDGGCYIEMMYNKYMRTSKSDVLNLEKERRLKEDGEEAENLSLRNDNDSNTIIEDVSYELLEEERGHNMSLISYLMLSFPYGFFSGCAFFLARYSLMIGHWKITIGMLGILLLLFMNYSYILLEKNTGYALWKSIGLCLFEGILIVVVVSTKVLEPYRIILFMICGVLCMIIEAINLWQVKQENYNDEDAE